MKKKFTRHLSILTLIICMISMIVFLSACSCGTEDELGQLVYIGSRLSATAGEETNLDVATATGASDITYQIKTGILPEGLNFNAGKISGTPKRSGSTELIITASASGFMDIDAKWLIDIAPDPNALEINDFTAANGYVGQYYTDVLAKATGSDEITYTIKSGTLPAGLVLEPDGFIHGRPTANGETTVVMEATAEGKISAQANVTILIRREAEASVAAGTITYNNKTLSGAMQDMKYVALSTSASGIAYASSSNRNVITYTLASGSTLPAGIILYEDGTLYGTPTAFGNYTFSITASAANCASVTAVITFNVSEPALIYSKFINVGTTIVGSEFTYDVGLATAPRGGVVITYKVKTTTPIPAGLTLSSAGMITGIPTASTRSYSFIVIASAEGFSDTESTITIVIKDKEVVVENGRLEGEYIDLTDIMGTGYSGSAFQEGMVQRDAINASTGNPTVGASNGFYVGYTHGEVVLTYNFKSSAARNNVTFDIGLTCEIGDVTFTPAAFQIVLNGQSINYSGISFTGASAEWSSAKQFNLTSKASLLEGNNTVILIVHTNALRNGVTGGPALDYIQFSNYGNAVLSWTPCLYNIANK